MKKQLLFALGLCATAAVFTSCDDDDDAPEWTDLVTFEDVELGKSGYVDTAAYVYDGIVSFKNSHSTWGSYFGVSLKTDTVTAGYLNDASVFGTGGNNGSRQFGYCYYSEYSGEGAIIELAENDKKVTSFCPNKVYLSLNTYAALALRDGNDGGVYGDAVKLRQGGYFSVTFTGYNGEEKAGSVTAYPGDWRGESRCLMTTWTAIDLKPLGEVTKIEVTFDGSEDLRGAYGLNVPAYIALDDLSFTRNVTK